jgi:hypothetical protein
VYLTTDCYFGSVLKRAPVFIEYASKGAYHNLTKAIAIRRRAFRKLTRLKSPCSRKVVCSLWGCIRRATVGSFPLDTGV